MNAPIYYRYHHETSEYIGQVDAAIDPLETKKAGKTVYMSPPAFATSDEPIGASANQADVYTDDIWSIVPDHRGETHYDVDGNKILINELGVEPQADWTIEQPLKLQKKVVHDKIRAAYNTEVTQPVTKDGIEYHGGYDSATKLDSAKRWAELAGKTEVTFYDTKNVGHVLSIADANAVIIQLGQQIQTLFAKKQGMMVSAGKANISALDKIVW